MNEKALAWLLAQMDFAVELLGEKNEAWEADQKSRLLELVLGVANLSEFLFHNRVPVGPSD